MKNTSRIKTRIIAGILSAITVISVGTVAMTSASAATLPSTGDKASDIVINAGYQAGLTAIKLGIPGGTAIAPMLDSIIGSFMPKGLSLTDINNNINELRSEISTQFVEVKKQITDSTNAIEKKIVNQSVIAEKGDSFDSLMTAMKATDRQLRSISENDDLNDQEKAVEMAYLIGDNADWLKKDNVYFQYEDFMNTLSSSTFADCGDRDLFRVIYDDYTAKVMFSGEALDRADPYVNRVIYLGLYAYSMCAQCLKAHRIIAGFTEEDIAKLHPNQLSRYNKVISPMNNINTEITEITDKMFCADRADSVAAHFDVFKNTSRFIFVNKGTASREYRSSLLGWKVFGQELYGQSPGFLDYLQIENMSRNSMSYSDISALWKYVQENYKDMTWREYLTKVGFDVSQIPKDSKLTYSGACSTTSEKRTTKYWVDAFNMDGPKEMILNQKVTQASFMVGSYTNFGTYFMMFYPV